MGSRGQTENSIETQFGIWLKNNYPELRYIKMRETHYPDRLIVFPALPPLFLEWKNKRGSLRPGQAVMIDRLRESGFAVEIVRELKSAQEIIQKYLQNKGELK